jgi:diaminopropionate ammonia-lyase
MPDRTLRPLLHIDRNVPVHPDPLDGDPLAFHRTLPDYAPTPLVSAPGIAAALGLGSVWVKDETRRLGLPAFKILGASWAICHALGAPPTFSGCRAAVAARPGLELVAATEGNHGQAVARMARLLGAGCEILVPAGTASARIAAIEAEGARVEVVRGTYDDAVAASAARATDDRLVISDTSWEGYTDIPRRVIQGYSTLLDEVEVQAHEAAIRFDAVVVQVGVGALAAAVAGRFAGRSRLIAVEPVDAGCAFASARAGHRVTVPGPHRSVMAGLNCGVPSLVAWPVVGAAFEAFVLIDDELARRAVKELETAGLRVGETGAAGLGGLMHLCETAERSRLGLDERAAVLVLATEGRTG